MDRSSRLPECGKFIEHSNLFGWHTPRDQTEKIRMKSSKDTNAFARCFLCRQNRHTKRSAKLHDIASPIPKILRKSAGLSHGMLGSCFDLLRLRYSPQHSAH
eukprot:Lankesteria_metandrocarpae@DN4870_c0_g1_i2.p2